MVQAYASWLASWCGRLSCQSPLAIFNSNALMRVTASPRPNQIQYKFYISALFCCSFFLIYYLNMLAPECVAEAETGLKQIKFSPDLQAILVSECSEDMRCVGSDIYFGDYGAKESVIIRAQFHCPLGFGLVGDRDLVWFKCCQCFRCFSQLCPVSCSSIDDQCSPLIKITIRHLCQGNYQS